MEQMRIKHNETGRSMVEMLGVLAVVGVLSIGGVAGYRYAVDKMNANEIINELKKRAITASQQRVLGQDINLSEYGNNGAIKGYTVTPTKNYDGNASQFALAVAGVPERVCDMIIDSDWALPTAKVVNGGSCVDGGNTMTFAFNNALGSGDAGNGETPDVTTEATTEVTAAETEVTETISEPEESVSEEDNRCGEHGTWVDDMCGSRCVCDDGWGGSWAGTYCFCFTDGTQDIEPGTGSCECKIGWYGDDCSLEGIATEETETETEVSESDEIWTDLDETVTETEVTETISEPEESVSEEEGPCPSGQIMDSYGYCYSCSTTYGISGVTATECAKCDSTSTPRIMSSSLGACVLPCGSGQFMDSSGYCRSCATSYGYSTTAEECAKCDDTRWPRVMSSGGACALPCGSGQFMSNDGTCKSCSTSSRVYGVTATECAKCDDTSTPRTMYGDYCGLKSCPSGQFLSKNGDCYSCSEFGGIYDVTAAECAKCDDSSTPRFMSNSGYCNLCSTSSNVSTTAEECAKCDNTSTPRYMDGSYCKKR